jgi:GT2 family glycosyltransferase
MEFPETNGSVADGAGTVALGRGLGEETVLETNRSKLDLSIIVVSFNTREMTLECLRSVIQESRGSTFEVLFIDNGSTDGSFKSVQSEFGSDSRFNIIESKENLGFAGANNRMADSARGEYILLLNPDTVVLDEAIEELLQFARKFSENRIWGGRTFFADGSLNPGSCWGPFSVRSEIFAAVGLRALFPKSTFFNPRGYGKWKRDTIREVGIVEGSFFLIKRVDWELLSGFDPEFFMYGEEEDLCMRGIKLGMKPILNPDAKIIHHGGASEKVPEDKMVRLLDGRIRIFRRHLSKSQFEIVFLALCLGIVIRSNILRIRNWLSLRSGDNDWRRVWRRRNEWSRARRAHSPE